MDLLDAGTYYWRVRAINTTDSTYSAWSPTWSFITPPQIEGTIYDAMTVNPGPATALPYVNLQVSGTSWMTTTNGSGAYSFRGLPPGTYNLIISKGSYMRQTRKISISRGNNIVQDFDIVPIPPENTDTTKPSTVRIQLVWGSSVSKMDSNLWLPSTNYPCQVSKADNHLDTSDPAGCNLDPTITGTHAQLVADEDRPYGTEVITIDAFSGTTDKDPYVYAVNLNEAASRMGGSGAIVTVYEGSDLKGTFSVPSSSNGTWWKVFTLKVNGASVTVTSVNSVGTKYPGPY